MMSARVLTGLLGLFFSFPLIASAAGASKVVVAAFTKNKAAEFEAQSQPLFKRFVGSCDCELRNLTPYNEKGDYDPSQLVARIQSLPPDVSFVFFDWNERGSDRNQSLVEELSKLTPRGLPVVAAAGVPPTNEGTCPLDRTLMGQVSQALIIGELTERDRLLPMCFYGPEMLSAIRPPRDLMGQGHAPLYFAARLASQWNKRSPQDWPSYLRARKNKSKRIWPELEEFLPR